MEDLNEIKNYSNENVYAGFWIRVGATILDCVILIPVMIIYMVFLKDFLGKNWLAYSIYSLLLLGYTVFFVVRFGGTPGKLIIGIKIINNGKNVTISQAIFRNIIYIINLIIIVILNYFALSTPLKYILDIINEVIGFLFLIDILFIPFSSTKRALHDYIVNTFVVLNKNRNN